MKKASNTIKIQLICLFSLLCINSSFAQMGLTDDVNIFLPTPVLNLALNEPGDLSIGYGTENLPNSFVEIGYSPIKHIDIQANFFNADRWQSKDNIYKIGVGGYYFLTRKKEKNSNISDAWGLQSGLLFNAHVGYVAGLKKFKTDGNIIKNFNAKYNGYLVEGGLHWITRLGMLQFMVGNININYRQFDLTESALIDESFWAFVDYVDEFNDFNLFTVNVRYNLAIQQGSIYYSINHTLDGWGNTDLINEQLNYVPNFPNIIFGVTLNINKLFPKINWQPKLFQSSKIKDEEN